MTGSRDKSSKTALGKSAYRRLIAAGLPVDRRCGAQVPLSPSKMGSVGCPSVQQSLSLSGLEEAVCAALETTEVIRRAWGARSEVQKANVEASALTVRQLEHARLLAEALHERSLKQLVQAEYAQLSNLRFEDVQRLLD